MEYLKEQLPDMDSDKFIFVILLVITVYMIWSFYSKRDKLTSAMLVAVAGAMFVFGVRIWKRDQSSPAEYMKIKKMSRRRVSENLVGLPPKPRLTRHDTNPTNGDKLNTDMLDDTNLSHYGNISRDFDVDPVGQTDRYKQMTATRDETESPTSGKNKIDNSDVINDVLNGYSSTHVPQEAYSDNFHESKDRQWVHEHFQKPDNYMLMSGGSVALNDRAITANDMLTRRQIHRGDINKKATDGRVRATKKMYERFFAHELAENYARDWWDGEGDDMIGDDFETDFRTYE